MVFDGPDLLRSETDTEAAMRPENPFSEPEIRASIIYGVYGHLSRTGVDENELLEQVGLDRSILNQPLKMISQQSAAAYFELASEKLGDKCFGLRLGALSPGGSSGLLGHLVMAAPTARDALTVFAGFSPAYATEASCGYEEDRRSGISTFSWRYAEETAPRMQINCFTAAGILQRLRQAMGERWIPTRIDFEHREPIGCSACQGRGCQSCESLKLSILGDRAHFNQPENRIVHNTAALSQKMKTSDPVTWAMHLDYAQQTMSSMISSFTIVERVRAQIKSRLKSHTADLQTVSANLNMTPRGLQHQLNSAGTNFEAILTATRARIARRLLVETDMPVTEISFDLGYSDPSVFTRAAKRWFDETPREFRQRHRPTKS